MLTANERKTKERRKKVWNEGETHRMTVCTTAHRMTLHETVYGTVYGCERESSSGVREKTSLERSVNVK